MPANLQHSACVILLLDFYRNAYACNNVSSRTKGTPSGGETASSDDFLLVTGRE
jgi:hypothetical protein